MTKVCAAPGTACGRTLAQYRCQSLRCPGTRTRSGCLRTLAVAHVDASAHRRCSSLPTPALQSVWKSAIRSPLSTALPLLTRCTRSLPSRSNRLSLPVGRQRSRSIQSAAKAKTSLPISPSRRLRSVHRQPPCVHVVTTTTEQRVVALACPLRLITLPAVVCSESRWPSPVPPVPLMSAPVPPCRVRLLNVTWPAVAAPLRLKLAHRHHRVDARGAHCFHDGVQADCRSMYVSLSARRCRPCVLQVAAPAVVGS